jgi:hypothetical protein
MRALGFTARHCALLALTESCWLYALAITLANGQPVAGTTLPPWPLWFAVSSANLFANLLPEPEPRDRVLLAARLLAAAAGIGLLGLLPPRPEDLALAAYLVWHSRALAELDVPEARYRSSVFAGTVGVLATLLIRAFAHVQAPDLATAQTVTVAAFAAAATLSLLVAQRLQLIEEEDLAPSGGSAWVMDGAAVGSAILATALLLLLVPPTAHGGLALLTLLGNLLLGALYYLLLPIVTLFFALIYGPLSDLLRGMHLPPPRAPAQPDAAFARLRQQQALLNAALDNWLHVAEGLLAALVVLAVLLLVSGGIRRRADPMRRSSELRASVWQWNLLADWLAQWGRRAGAAAAVLLTQPTSLGQPRSVRDIYLDVQRRAGKLGCGRRPEQTALEHCALLAQRLPAVAPALQRVAVGYGDERYGGVPPATALPQLLPDWQAIVAACREDEANGP